MSIHYTDQESNIIADNIEYALGLYDLYVNDSVVVDALRLKGLPYHIIEGILFQIKKPAYLKRINQAKRHILWGSILLFSLLIVRFLLMSIPDSHTLLKGKAQGEEMMRFYFRFYREFFYFIMLLSGLRILSGIFLLIKYTRLISKKA